jgi:hypothetical protein
MYSRDEIKALTGKALDMAKNLDLIGSRETWKMLGTGGDAKGQPTQTNR